MTHDLLLLLLFIYIFVNFCTAHLNETEADHGSKREREGERDCVSVLISRFHFRFFLHFLVNVLLSSSEARGRAYVILLILIGNKRPQVALSLSLCFFPLSHSVYNETCMWYKKSKAHLSWS